jgi:serine phosphatase RsbU (regulator of sigma subunit)
MTTANLPPSIDEYLRKRLKPVEGAIPHLEGIEMYGDSIPAESVGGDLFEYINFAQRYNIDARIERAHRLAREYLQPGPPAADPRNEVEAHIEWMRSKECYTPEDYEQYRKARSSEQLEIAENLQELHTTAGVLLVDAQGHGVIAAKIASTVHDTFQALMMAELDRHGKTTGEFFENLNLRLALSVTARNALGRSAADQSREIATMLYGEIRPNGHFRFVNFGHLPPLIFSAAFDRFVEVDPDRLVQFLALGLSIPQDHPDRSKYVSMTSRRKQMASSDLKDVTLMGQGDILFLYTDGVYDGSDEQERRQIESIIKERKERPAKDICKAILGYALETDRALRNSGEADRVDDKTVFIIKRT